MSLISLHQQTHSLAQRLSRLQPSIDDSLARLSSGKRLGRPADDPIGVGIAARYDAQQKRLDAATVNLQNGASRLQITDSLLSGLGRTLSRMGELASLANGVSLSAADREVYSQEFRVLQDQIRVVIGGTTAEIGGTSDLPTPQGSFQGRPLFGPGPAGGDWLVAGADATNRIALPEINLRQGTIRAVFEQDSNGEFTFAISTPGALGVIKAAVDQIATGRAAVGGAQSRIEFAGSSIATAQTNAEAALSRIQDTDIATETTLLARRQMLAQSHTAMVAQARDVPRQLIPLLHSR
jgi:flagellin